MDACCTSWVLSNWPWSRVCDFQRRDPISSRDCCPGNIWRLVDQHCVKQLDFRVLCWENNVEDWVNRKVWEAVCSVNLLEYAPIMETTGLSWFYVIYKKNRGRDGVAVSDWTSDIGYPYVDFLHFHRHFQVNPSTVIRLHKSSIRIISTPSFRYCPARRCITFAYRRLCTAVVSPCLDAQRTAGFRCDERSWNRQKNTATYILIVTCISKSENFRCIFFLTRNKAMESLCTNLLLPCTYAPQNRREVQVCKNST